MASERTMDLETLLRQALSPIEPPVELEARLERKLGSVVDRAAEELESWERAAMRDPRNWIKPVGALVIGSAAAVVLVVVRTHQHSQQRRKQSANFLDLTKRTFQEAAHHARKEARRLIK